MNIYMQSLDMSPIISDPIDMPPAHFPRRRLRQ